MNKETMYVLEAEQHRGWYFGGMEATTDNPTNYWLTSDKMDAKRFEFASVAIAFGLTLPIPKYASAPMQWTDTQIQVAVEGKGTSSASGSHFGGRGVSTLPSAVAA